MAYTVCTHCGKLKRLGGLPFCSGYCLSQQPGYLKRYTTAADLIEEGRAHDREVKEWFRNR